MRRLLLELKIAGINFPLVTAALSLALVLFAALAGELLDTQVEIDVLQAALGPELLPKEGTK